MPAGRAGRYTTRRGDDHAISFGAAYRVHVDVVQRGEQRDTELLALTEKRLRDDRCGGHPVGIVVRENLYELMTADDVRGMR